jgi:hypothetical protein
MRNLLVSGVAAIAFLIGGQGAWSAAPATLDLPGKPAPTTMSAAPIEDYRLDTERVVKHWVLCISQTLAESLVRAREQSAAEAAKAFEKFKAARTCGLFAELRVILRQPIYASAENSGFDGRIFGASISIAGGRWAAGFVVSGVIDAQ